ncbi:MAG: metallophosphoesterase [Myxococcota bacterium]|nr:metallophosphoesterase [Myxococcota bacterium]
MLRIVTMVLFFTVFVALAIAIHVYLYRRLARDVFQHPRLQKSLRCVFILGGLGLVGGLPIVRLLPEGPGQVLAFICFGWMGFIAIATPIAVLWELPRFWVRRAQHVDEGRRRMLAKGVATVTTLSAGAAVARGVDRALSAPDIVEVSVPIAQQAPALKGLRIVQLSDVHFGNTIGRDFAEYLVETVNALDADVVALTGDFVDGSVAKLGETVSVLQGLKSRYGLYFVTGNHEYYSGVHEWVAAFESWGIRVLRNERQRLMHRGQPFDLIGVDDWRGARHAPGHGHDLDRAVRGRDASVPSILLAHQPKAIHDASKAGIDLVLSGHTHGGQIWPFNYAVKLVQPYVQGLHRHSPRTWIYVHRGTRYWGPPVRLGVNSEIAVLTVT